MKQFSPGKMVQKLLTVTVIGITAIIGHLSGTTASIEPPVDSQVTVQAATITNRTLQINFKYNTSTSDFKKQMLDYAPLLATVKGLRWKIWSMDETNREASGYYLFENEATLNAYLNNVFLVGMGNNPTVSNIVVKKI